MHDAAGKEWNDPLVKESSPTRRRTHQKAIAALEIQYTGSLDGSRDEHVMGEGANHWRLSIHMPGNRGSKLIGLNLPFLHRFHLKRIPILIDDNPATLERINLGFAGTIANDHAHIMSGESRFHPLRRRGRINRQTRVACFPYPQKSHPDPSGGRQKQPRVPSARKPQLIQMRSQLVGEGVQLRIRHLVFAEPHRDTVPVKLRHFSKGLNDGDRQLVKLWPARPVTQSANLLRHQNRQAGDWLIVKISERDDQPRQAGKEFLCGHLASKYPRKRELQPRSGTRL